MACLGTASDARGAISKGCGVVLPIFVLFLVLAGTIVWLSMLTLTLASERRALTRALDELTTAIAAAHAPPLMRIEPTGPAAWPWLPSVAPLPREHGAEVDRNRETLSDRHRAQRIVA